MWQPAKSAASRGRNAATLKTMSNRSRDNMDAKEIKELSDVLCNDSKDRIKKLEAKLFWFNTVAIGNLIAFILILVKEYAIK